MQCTEELPCQLFPKGTGRLLRTSKALNYYAPWRDWAERNQVAGALQIRSTRSLTSILDLGHDAAEAFVVHRSTYKTMKKARIVPRLVPH